MNRTGRPGLKERLGVLRHMMALSWRADRRSVLLIGFLVLFQSLAISLTALSQQWLIDAAALGAVTGVVVAALIGAAAHGLISAGNRIQINLQVDLTERVDVQVNEEVLTATTSLDTVEHLEHPEYLDRLTVLRRGTKSLAAVGWRIGQAASTTVSLLLALWLLLGVHPLLGLLIVVALPSLWTARRGRRLLKEARISRAEHERLEQELHDLCVHPRSVKELRITGAGPVIDERASAAWTRALAISLRAEYLAGAWRMAGWTCFAFGFLGALVLVAHQISRGQATLGELVLVMTLGSRIRAQVRFAVENFGHVSEAGQVTEQYLWLLEHAATQRRRSSSAAPPALDRGIALERVSYTYPGAEKPALHDVNLTLREGTTVALVGDNGAGKSTLVKLLTGMIEPSEGTIRVDGTDLGRIDPPSWRERSTGAFQDFVKFELTVRDAIAIGRLSDREAETVPAVHSAAQRAGVTGFVDRLPRGFDTQLGHAHAGVDLSHGQWQRIALARAFMRDDAVLTVLDEPTSALDPQAEDDLYDRFTRQSHHRDGRVTVLVSHRFSTVNLADQIIVLSQGRVVEHGTHGELMERGGHYAELYTMQARGFLAATADPHGEDG